MWKDKWGELWEPVGELHVKRVSDGHIGGWYNGQGLKRVFNPLKVNVELESIGNAYFLIVGDQFIMNKMAVTEEELLKLQKLLNKKFPSK